MRILPAALLALVLFVSVVPAVVPTHAQGAVQIKVNSTYTLNRYGFAVVNETVTFSNNGSSVMQAPDLIFGVGNLSTDVAAFNFTGQGFAVNRVNSTSGEFTIGGGANVPAAGSLKVSVVVLLQNVVQVSNSTFRVLVLTSPSLSLKVDTLRNLVQMPASTQLASEPTGLRGNVAGSNVTYSSSKTQYPAQAAATSVRAVKAASTTAPQDFHVLVVTSATRTITSGPDGLPVVTDSLQFENLGPTSLSILYVSPLTSASSSVTVLPGAGPRLLSATKVSMSNYGIAFTQNGPIGNPVLAGTGLEISYSYPLDSRYYSTSGGQVTLSIPKKPLIPDFVQNYAIDASFPSGVSLTQGSSQTFGGLTPWSAGHVPLAYSLNVGWGAAAGVPAASVVFVLLLVGLYVSRSTVTEAEETEEETSTERATVMVNAFDEKTSIINELWPAIESEDPNRLDKQYFDVARARMDSFKSRALQRLNELRQRSTSQRFADLLNQIQTTEREVDRAAKDKLNLYEQYYTKKMRKEVYDRLHPQYTKRLERALNQLSDELHQVQREAKLL